MSKEQYAVFPTNPPSFLTKRRKNKHSMTENSPARKALTSSVKPACLSNLI